MKNKLRNWIIAASILIASVGIGMVSSQPAAAYYCLAGGQNTTIGHSLCNYPNMIHRAKIYCYGVSTPRYGAWASAGSYSYVHCPSKVSASYYVTYYV